jgi:hypothetical protein
MTVVLHIVPRVAPEPPALLGKVPRRDAAEEEPSLTLCSTRTFFQAAGPLGRAAADSVMQSSAFRRLSAATGPGHSIRWTSQLLWVRGGEVPAARYEWHLDRVGPGWTGADGEVADYSDNAAAGDGDTPFGLVSYFWPDDSKGPASLGTEFLLEHLEVPVEQLVDDPRTVGDAITRCVDTLRESGTVSAFESGVLVWFGPRTLHRPPVAATSGWRFLLRVGLYREPYSPYSDHRLCCHRLHDTRAGKPVFRPVGTQETHTAWNGPLSRPVCPCG